MSSNPCKICGSTDLNLVDGFYYCVECGTQDVNVQETVIEQTMLADGTYAHVTTKKFSTVLQDAVEMSGEWHKWHAFNFILAGLTEELIALGAKPTVKMLVLWIWTRYIKKFQKKDNVETTQFENKSLNEENKAEEINEEDSDDTDDLDELDELSQKKAKKKLQKKKKKKSEKFRRDIKIVTKGSLLTILYVALNLDKSDIQLTHLFRFIREGRLSLYNCLKFVPKELSVKLIPKWMNFTRCHNEYTPRVIRAYAMTVFKQLDLGVPLVPDLNKIILDYIKELCLPVDLKDLVLSLINLMPCNFLQLDTMSLKCLVRVPDYEGICMSYILIALKMCFGLDNDYEIKLSDAVDKVNTEADHLKAYKLGMYSEPTDRLFSFREWYMFLQFRKTIVCKYYLPMARQYNLPVDDCVFMEHLEERNKRKIRLMDEVTMDILNKIPINDMGVIPKKEFISTLTPMTTYTETILEYIQDPDLKLRLCEDFSQYSLKYATRDLKLPGTDSEQLIRGVDKVNKIINPRIIGTLISKEGDATMVLVRNCKNKNWLKTKPPTIRHVTKINKNKGSIGTSDPGYDSSSEPILKSDNGDDEIGDSDEELNCDDIEEEDEGLSIFDDDFKNLQILEDDKSEVTPLLLEDDKSNVEETNASEFHNDTYYNVHDSKIEIHDTFSETSAQLNTAFNPETFDRKKIIQELIEIACKKYKIPFPKEKEEKEPRQPRKRKKVENNEAGQSAQKKRKSDVNINKFGESSKTVQGFIDAYYENVNNDVLHKISEQIQLAIQMNENQEEQNETDNAVNVTQLESEFQNPDGTDRSHLNIDDERHSFGHDSSVQEITLNDTVDDDNNIEELLPKSDPKFDSKTHDIEQLYVKFKEVDIQDITNIESDPELNEFIDKKISEYPDSVKQSEENLDKEKEESSDTSNSEDEVPLSVLLEEKLRYTAKKQKRNLEQLVLNPQLNHFTYWMKHYKSRAFIRSLDMNHKFNIELMENCPISFVFVIRECAAILNCTMFCLYKCIQTLEESLISHIKN